ncbi:hypothetical protein [Kutzneria chonburiensis]|uniref:Uncharacterized protein n=1 Tax=Kutzneria chonburiensis TaxID=1483604 RepID=A0ABV6N3J8_9PSEU|nr:hypothetical protein [Kutzneria chonburiensis]
MTDDLPADARYREITAWIGDAMQDMREQNTERGQLVSQQLDFALAATMEMLSRADESMSKIDDLWQTAMAELFHETWMGAMRPIPRPDTTVPPRPLEFYEDEAKQACEALLDAIKRKGILGR